MARKVECGNFLVIEATRNEMSIAVDSPGICDFCGKPSENGYYIAVLNQWFCLKCYESWKQFARYYPHDRPVEEKNFKYYGQRLGVVLPDYMAEAGCEIVDSPLNLMCCVAIKYKGKQFTLSLRLLKHPNYIRSYWEYVMNVSDDTSPQES